MGDDLDQNELSKKVAEKLGMAEVASHEDLRSNFVDHKKKLVQSQSNVADLEAIESEIEEICILYFDYNEAVAKNMAKGMSKGTKDHEDAKHVKNQAGAITRGIKKSVIQFAHSELALYATLNKVEKERDEITTEAPQENVQIEWNYELPQEIALACRRRDVFSGYIMRMSKAKPVVELLDIVLKFLKLSLVDLLKEEKANKIFSDFIYALRKSKFSKAPVPIKEIAEKDSKAFFRWKKAERRSRWKLIVEIADLVTLLVQRFATRLTDKDDKICLRSLELDKAYNETNEIYKKACDFIDKYQIPEIQYRIDAIKRQQGKLYELGTFDSWLDILENIEKGCALPMKDMKEVRAFEADCYKKAMDIIEQRTEQVEQTISKVEQLSYGPDPESIPDDMLYTEKEEEEYEKAAAA